MTESLPPLPAVHSRNRAAEGSGRRGRLEHLRPANASAGRTPSTRNGETGSEHIVGRDEIVAFLTRKWQRELDYSLRKSLWSFHDNRIAVRFQYECHDATGQWYRSYGNELWEFSRVGFDGPPGGQHQRRRRSTSPNGAISGRARPHEHGQRLPALVAAARVFSPTRVGARARRRN